MSLRRFMHPRNKYKQEPNFKQLAILYPEFRKVAITDLAGKVRINFHDLESLKVLAKILLKHDFDLDVEIPPTKLVPAIPSRLNYVLWIEDLAKHSGLTDMSSISGIDIGTGAVCIYPLLFAKLYGCKIIGTEIDSESYESAKRNVKKNKLEHLVEVIRVNKDTLLGGSLPIENNVYTFTMCNPPFFCTQEASVSRSKSSGNRMPPRNAPSGSKIELVVEGGETQFVLRMLNESLTMKEKVKIYTTMLGKKSSLTLLLNELKKFDIENSTWTEFCQGHTTRWGLAWSFFPKTELDLTTAPVIRISNSNDTLKQKIKKPPSEIIFPARNGVEKKEELIMILKRIFKELKIRVEELDVDKRNSSCWGCRLIIDEDNWSHERRRKRQMKTNQSPPSKKLRLDVTPNTKFQTENEITVLTNDNVSTETMTRGSFLTCNLIVGEIEPENDKKILKISIDFENGTGGRNALETLRQYLINKLELRDLVKEQSSVKKIKKKQRVRKKNKTMLENVL